MPIIIIHSFQGRIIDHELQESEEIVRRMAFTERLWNKLFSEEPYYASTKAVNEFVTNFSYNIEAASKRQQMFYYQVEESIKLT